MQKANIINWDKIPAIYSRATINFYNYKILIEQVEEERPEIELMCYTSLMHYNTMNIQSDFHGIKDTVIKMFRQECFHRGVVWAKLFDKNGNIVDNYFEE